MAEPKKPEDPDLSPIPLADEEDAAGDDSPEEDSLILPLAEDPADLKALAAPEPPKGGPSSPKRSAPAPPPSAPLPRLWKAQPDEDAEDEQPSKKKARKGGKEVELVQSSQDPPARKGASKPAKIKKPPKDEGEGGGEEKKGVLIEETPYWETQEARERVRLALGGSLVAIIALTFFFIASRLLPEKAKEDEPVPVVETVVDDPPAPAPVARDEEGEARTLFNRAKEASKHRNTQLSLTLLKSVATKYPTTAAAAEAKQALDRPARNLPLFPEHAGAVAVARPANPPTPRKAPPPRPPAAVVAATTGAPISHNSNTANLVPPANPVEPSTGPALSTTPVSMPAPGSPATAPKPTKPLPRGYEPRLGSAVHQSGWAMEIVGHRDGAPMAFIPGGTFIQGRDDADVNESPAHYVKLGAFYMDRHEVTVRQFKLFEQERGHRTERIRALRKVPSLANIDAEDDHPVVMVSARDAREYAEWARKFLPTEAQWEAAARTPDGRIYPWGPTPPHWSKPRVYRQIDSVMSHPTDMSPYGLFDLSGNAWEWTKDWYDPKYYSHLRGVTADNPVGPPKPRSLQLVVKGSGKDWTVSKREGMNLDTRLPFIGFRCAIQVEGPGNVFEPPPSDKPAPGDPPATPTDTNIPPF